MASGSQETPQSGMNLFLGTVLLLLLLPGEWQVKGAQAPLAQGVPGLCGKVFSWESVHQKTMWGFHPEMLTGQRGASPLGCTEVWGFVTGGFFKTWDQQSGVSFVSPSGRLWFCPHQLRLLSRCFEAHITAGLFL